MMASLGGTPTTPKTPIGGDSNIDKLLKWIAKRINQYPVSFICLLNIFLKNQKIILFE